MKKLLLLTSIGLLLSSNLFGLTKNEKQILNISKKFELSENDYKKAKELIEKEKINIDIQDEKKNTPLHYLLKKIDYFKPYNMQLLKLVAEKSKKPNTKNNNNKTAIEYVHRLSEFTKTPREAFMLLLDNEKTEIDIDYLVKKGRKALREAYILQKLKKCLQDEDLQKVYKALNSNSPLKGTFSYFESYNDFIKLPQ